MVSRYHQVKLTREKLYEQIWATPARELAKQFYISDVALGKICRRMNVPKPPRGYWERLKAGAQIPRPPLPKTNDSTRDATFLRIPDAVEIPSEANAVIDVLLSGMVPIKLADDLDHLHPLVQTARQYFEKADPNADGLLSPPKGDGFISVTISQSQSSRGLLILDALFRRLESCGYTVVVSSDHWGEQTRIAKEGEWVVISLYEKAREVKHELTPEQKKKPTYLLNLPAVYQPDGKLHVKVNETYGAYRRISDRQNVPIENRLEEILSDVICLLESRVSEKRKREEAEKKRQEALRQQQKERDRREAFERDVLAWQKSEAFRKYLHAFEAKLQELDRSASEYEALSSWLAWARNYVDSIDPLNEQFPAGQTGL